jgi:hypothetical protein
MAGVGGVEVIRAVIAVTTESLARKQSKIND